MFIHAWTLPWISILLLPIVSSQTPQSTPLPFVLPLALRSPYLHAWTRKPNVSFSWPIFWNHDNLGWEGMIRIDDHAYQWLGVSGTLPDVANITNTQITPTRTIFTYIAGPAQLTATFLSPIERSDPVKQSIPFSYISLDVNFTDGLQHRVQVYMDISGEWVTPSRSDIITWSTSTVGTSSSSFHQIQRNAPQALVEAGDRAEDTTAVIGAKSGPSVSVVVGEAGSSRRAFSTNGVVSGGLTPPAKMGNPYPVFTVVQDLGNISATTSPVVFAIGVYRNPSILLTTTTSTGKTQAQTRAPLFAASLSSISDVMDTFLSDFPNAKSRADDVDSIILNAAGNISEPYKDLVFLAARQTMASTDLTIANGTDGRWNMSDIKMFMKDVGVSGRVNPVEKIYASFPFFLFINSTYAGQLLSPLLELQDSSSNDQAFAARDLGQNYPQASGTIMKHEQQVEHTSSMLIMAFAHARISGDGTLISRHYSLLRKWAEYLIDSTMSPPDSSTVNGATYANSTNLVIKGIIALKAMSDISNAVSLADDANRYFQFSSAFMTQWSALTQTSSSDSHLPLSLGGGSPSSWSQMYNLYADKLLNTSLIDEKIFQTQAQFYQSELSRKSGGLSLDSTNVVASVAWSFFTAATISDSTIRNNLISSVHDQFFKKQANGTQPFPVNYNTDGSNAQGAGNASPAVGAIFAPLALSLSPAQSITIPPPTPPQATPEKPHTVAGPIAGGVLGGLTLLLLVTLGVFYLRRRRNQTKFPRVEAFTAESGIDSCQDHTHNSWDSASHLHMAPREEISRPFGGSGKTGQVLGPNRPPATNAVPTSISIPTVGSSIEPPSTAPSGISGFSRNAGTGSRSSRSQLSATELRGLRSEVKNLRQVMQQLQVDRPDRIQIPPTYAI
ncbi:hypothetical protein QCA50_021058 [Cerrena zonata]|uniref:DUF1793-domain-containing protein n=1 Tax=Cerrena zonata TaxID=2478898 RepID=A0AAW0F9E0_9APHY